jgi:ADP-ribose pyrophosphatase YjhB (NUDIX family)
LSQLKSFLLNLPYRLIRLFPPNSRLRWLIVWLAAQKFVVGVTGIILNEEGEILLFYHTYRRRYPWGLPGGLLQAGEQPAAGLEREIDEEAGFEAEIQKLLFIEPSNKVAQIDFIFQGVIREGTFRPSLEVSDARFFALDDLPELLPLQDYLIDRAVRKLETEKVRT